MTYDRLRNIVADETPFRRAIDDMYRRLVKEGTSPGLLLAAAAPIADNFGLAVKMHHGMRLVFTLRSTRAARPACIVATLATGQYDAAAMLCVNMSFAHIEVFEENDYDVEGDREDAAHRGQPEGGALWE